MAARGPQNGRRGLEMYLPLDFGHSKQLSLNKFFDPITPSLLVGDDPWVSGRRGLERGVPLGFWVF